MDNPETQARHVRAHTTQQSWMDSPETQARTVRAHTTQVIMDGQSRDTGKIRHTRHRTNNPETLAIMYGHTQRHSNERPRDIGKIRHIKTQIRTTQRHWQETLEHIQKGQS